MCLSIQKVFGSKLADFKQLDHVLVAKSLQIMFIELRVCDVLQKVFKLADVGVHHDLLDVCLLDAVPI